MALRGVLSGAMTKMAPHAESTYMRLGGMGKKGKALRQALDGGTRSAGADIRKLGVRRAQVGAAGIVGLGALGQVRSSGISSGANGTQPHSMGGYTGY